MPGPARRAGSRPGLPETRSDSWTLSAFSPTIADTYGGGRGIIKTAGHGQGLMYGPQQAKINAVSKQDDYVNRGRWQLIAMNVDRRAHCLQHLPATSSLIRLDGRTLVLTANCPNAVSTSRFSRVFCARSSPTLRSGATNTCAIWSLHVIHEPRRALRARFLRGLCSCATRALAGKADREATWCPAATLRRRDMLQPSNGTNRLGQTKPALGRNQPETIDSMRSICAQPARVSFTPQTTGRCASTSTVIKTPVCDPSWPNRAFHR
jgi:hypothetical protein